MKVWTHHVARTRDFGRAAFVDISVMKDLRVSVRVPLAAVWPEPVLKMRTPLPPPDSFPCGPLEIGSERLVNILQRYVTPTSVEFLPVRVKGDDRKFYSINPIGYVDALDKKRAVFTEESGFIDEISRLVLKSNVADRPLFALKSFMLVWIVSDAVAEEILRSGITGLAFEAPEKWRSA